MHTHTEAVSGRVVDGEVGVIEGRVIETTELQPWIAASEDMVDDGWSSSIRVCLAAVAGEPKPERPFWFPGSHLRQDRGAESLASFQPPTMNWPSVLAAMVVQSGRGVRSERAVAHH